MPRGPRNGPSRQRRRKKREAARAEKKATENSKTLPAVEADKELESEENVQNTDAEEALEPEANLTAEKAEESTEEVKVPMLDDEFCSDATYRSDTKEMKSIHTQTLETGIRPLPSTTSGFDYYTLQYDDLTDSE